MKRIIAILLAAAILLAGGASLTAQEPSFHGYVQHQLVTLLNDAQLVRNAVTAEVELGYTGADVDLLINPFFEIAPGADPMIGLREAYLDYRTNAVDFRIGKQIIIWGKADGLAITDIVSPKDLTNFLIPDFRELRMGVIAARVSTYLGPTVIELIYVPQFNPSVMPPQDSIWFSSLETSIEPTVSRPPVLGLGLEDGEFYGRLRMQGSALDFDLAGGYYWTNEPSPTIIKEFSSPGVLSSVVVTPEYYRQWLAGGAFSSSIGPFILRAETGFFTPKRFLTSDPADSDGYVEKNYLQSLAGIDTVLAGTDLSAQLMHQFIDAYEEPLIQDEHSWTATVRARRSFLQEQLVFDLLAYIGISTEDALLKAGVTLVPADALSLRIEGNLFFGDSGQFGTYDDNDLVVISTRYSY